MSIGGIAANSGIEYQQRVSAWFLSAMLLQIDLSNYFSYISKNTLIENIVFEGQRPIDDLNVICANNLVLYMQIKKSIYYSVQQNSPFSKTIEQFIKQYVRSSENNDIYILATSVKSSDKILNNLARILESVHSGSVNNEIYFNEDEKEIYIGLYKLCQEIYYRYTRKDLNTIEYNKILNKIHIMVFNIEKDMSDERTIFSEFKQASNIEPQLIWAVMLKEAALHAGQGLSVGKSNFIKKHVQYLSYNKNVSCSPDDNKIGNIIMPGKEMFSADREVVLVESVDDTCKYTIFDLLRFDNEGKKRFEFRNDEIVILGDNISMKLIYRCSNLKEMAMFLKANENLCFGKIGFFDEKNELFEGSHVYAKIYADLCWNLLKRNNSYLMCIHCTKPISENTAKVVEIDILNEKHNMGLVHLDCLKLSDRILGCIECESFEKYAFLKKFDSNIWHKALSNSHMIYSFINQLNYNKQILWSHSKGYDKNNKYCLKIKFSDGSFAYLLERGKVKRYAKDIAEKQCEGANRSIKNNKSKNNSLYYIKSIGLFGTYSIVYQKKDNLENILECVGFEVDQYNLTIADEFDSNKNYYTPIAYLKDSESEKIVCIANHLVLITNPLSIGKLLENWRKVGFLIPEYEVEIIDDDNKFDNFIEDARKSNLKIIMDPYFGLDGNLVDCIHIKYSNEEFGQFVGGN